LLKRIILHLTQAMLSSAMEIKKSLTIIRENNSGASEIN